MTAICKNLLIFAKFFRRHHPQSSESKSSFKKTHFEGWNLYLLSFDVDAAQFFELNIFRVQRYDRFRHYKKIPPSCTKWRDCCTKHLPFW